MSFDYEKLKQKQVGTDNSWSSNSDLFMVLSLVFLLLYVVSSLRNGSSSVQKTIQYQELKNRNEDLEQQILAYEALKEDYLQKEASNKEMQMYSELMDKLSLLQDEAKEEKNDLRKKALENEKKENALNKYQQIIRNIVNTNLLAQKRINKRDSKIKTQSITIKENTQTIQKNTITINKQKQDIEKQKNTIKEKLKVIASNKRIITRKRKEAKKLKMAIYKNKQTIRDNNRQINKINKNLENSIKKLNEEYKNHKHSKKQLKNKIATIRKKSQFKITKLQKQNVVMKSSLNKVGKNLKVANNHIETAKKVMARQAKEQRKLTQNLKRKEDLIKKTHITYSRQIKDLRQEHNARMKREKDSFEKNLKKQKLSYSQKAKKLKRFNLKMKKEERVLKNKINNLNSLVAKKENILKQKSSLIAKKSADIERIKNAHTKRMNKERKAFEKSLGKQKLSNAQKAKELRAFKSKMQKEEKKMNQKLAKLKNNIQNSKGQLNNLKKELVKSEKIRQRSIASAKGLKNKNQKLSSELQKAKSLIDTRRKLAKKIQNNLKRAGINAKVNSKTGDVTISFGKEYFESGSAHLKKGMLASLKKFIPTYSSSVFSDPQISKKVAAVEVIGFASPTYMGRFVNPKSLKKKDQKAVRYNLKLSQSRANSVFNYIFDKEKIQYQYQKRLYPLVKVTGRSFISNEIKDAHRYEGMTNTQFCSKYDCKKAQRVIIKFSLKN